jgi:hypothetical protein
VEQIQTDSVHARVVTEGTEGRKISFSSCSFTNHLVMHATASIDTHAHCEKGKGKGKGFFLPSVPSVPLVV